ncbi:hypothetical protein [Dongia mobilis]|uniref:hypothetical protein n=1 Tax=Dongia sp. TaxID=1977262 RepID=UPI0026EE08FD
MHRSLSVAISTFANPLRFLAPIAIVGGALWTGTAAADGWPVAHGNPANTSYQDVVTAPARTPSNILNDLGTFADGISPIVSAQGNVFLGNLEGRIFALRSDGTRWWDYQMESGWSVRSTPALNSRGELFLLASRTVNDHRGSATVKRIQSLLLAFADGGRLLYQVQLPTRGLGGISTAPLNIVRGPANTEVVVFPMRYAFSEGYYQQLWLLAYGINGVVEAEVKVADEHGTISGEEGFQWGHGFNIPGDPNALPTYQPPVPGVAVPHGNGLDPSIVVVNDDMGSVARYRFTGRFADGFAEIERWTQGEKDPAISAPVVALNGAVLFNRPRDVLILQTDGTDAQRKVKYEGYASPAVLPNGRIIHESGSTLQEAGGGTVIKTGSSYVSPTATRNHVYVAEYGRLATYRIDDLSLVESYAWEFGGRQQPVIGPLGHIYALNFNKLYIFPPDSNVATATNIGPGGVAGTSVDQGGDTGSGTRTQPMTGTFNPAILTQPQDTAPGSTLEPGAVYQPALNNAIGDGSVQSFNSGAAPATETASLPASQRFDPPLTADGHALSACVDADFKQCGKEAARAYCTSLGFAKAKDIDIDTKKVAAQTLGGALCSKSKCQVVDQVTCSR